MKNFLDFLGEKHMEECPCVLDDDLGDSFDNWLSNLDGEEWLKYGEEAIQYFLNK